jgi:CBS domain-containing protein
MKIKDIMTSNVECLWPDDTLQEAALTMKERNIGLLPVCNRDHVAGMLSDRDITIRAVADGCDPKSTRVRDVMTTDVICCCEDDNVDQAARLMRERQVRRILVFNRNKLLAGIVSLGDLAAEIDDCERVGEILHDVSEPATLAGS